MTQRTQCFEWAHRAGPPTHHFAVHCLHLVSFLWFPQSPPDQTQCLANLSQSVLPWLRPATFPPTKMSHVLYMCSVGSMHMYMHAWSIYVSICTYICAAAQPTSHAGQDPCVQYSTGSGPLACLHGMPDVYHIGWPLMYRPLPSKSVCLVCWIPYHNSSSPPDFLPLSLPSVAATAVHQPACLALCASIGFPL